jgi:protein-histidine N-methyltransferase
MIGEIANCRPRLYKRHVGDVQFDIARQHYSILSDAMTSHQDVIQGKYEGGLKTWECSIDLVNYLSESTVLTEEMKVIEVRLVIEMNGIVRLWFCTSWNLLSD